MRPPDRLEESKLLTGALLILSLRPHLTRKSKALLFGALISFGVSLRAADPIPSTVSPPFKPAVMERIEGEQTYNNRFDSTKRNFMTAKDKAPIGVFVVEFPLVNLKKVSEIEYSDDSGNFRIFIDDSEKQFVAKTLIKTVDGQSKLRTYFKSEEQADAMAKEYGGTVVRSDVAIKILSHNTFVEQNSADLDYFHVKFPREDLDAYSVINAVAVSHILSELTGEYPPKTFDFMREPGAVIFKNGYHFSLRNPDTKQVRWTDTESLHVLLGLNVEGKSSGQLERYAAACGLTVTEWLKAELLPKLGKFLAESVFRFGTLLEMHAQNTQVLIGDDGRIQKFFYRDARDAYLDPVSLEFMQKLKPKWIEDENLKSAFSIDPAQLDSTHHHINSYKYAGMRLGTTVPQISTAASRFAGPNDYTDFQFDILKSFLAEAVELGAVDPTTLASAQAKIRAYDQAKVDKNWRSYYALFSKNIVDGAGEDYFAYIVQEIYDGVLKAHLAVHQTAIPATQQELAEKFLQGLRSEKVGFTYRNGVGVLGYFRQQNQNKKPGEALVLSFKHPDSLLKDHPKDLGQMSLTFAQTSQGIVAATTETGHVLGLLRTPPNTNSPEAAGDTLSCSTAAKKQPNP